MKFEYTSNYRDRNLYPSCGNFSIESGIPIPKSYALDPVCLSAPIISWKPGFSLSATITALSATDVENLELFLTFGAPPPLQVMTLDFLAGCIIVGTAVLSLNYRILSSVTVSSTIVRVTVPTGVFSIGTVVNVVDYTTFSPLNVRAPTRIDLGKYAILYNETKNQSVNITSCNLSTRRLEITPSTVLAGWVLTDQLNIRDEIPQATNTILSSTTTTVTLNLPAPPPFSIGSWLRLRLADYSVVPSTDSWTRQIVNVVGQTVTFFPQLTVAPTGTVEFLPFSYDNYNPSQGYDHDLTKRYYNVTLEALIIPNVKIYNGNLRSIPYLMVEINNNQSPTANKNLINSNNPYVTHSVWVAKLDPTSTRDDYVRFIATDTRQLSQRILIDVKEPLNFVVKLPGGQVFTPLQSDTRQPNRTISDLNISVIIDYEDAEHPDL